MVSSTSSSICYYVSERYGNKLSNKQLEEHRVCTLFIVQRIRICIRLIYNKELILFIAVLLVLYLVESTLNRRCFKKVILL